MSNFQNMQLASCSLVMHGIKKCSGSCIYCSAASTMNYREGANKTSFVFDKEKTKKRILEYCEEPLKLGIENGNGTELNIDIWGGNPVENFSEFKEVVDFCENELKEFRSIKLHTSGNGLELRDKDIVNFLIDHGIKYQLSHDGLGQWLRTGEIDPLYWEKTKDNIADLAKRNILDWVNCTLSARNPSFFDNIEYWNKWRKEIQLDMNIPFVIKLNHIYEGTPPIKKKWVGKTNNYIKHGEEIGDLCFHGDQLQEYLHEFRKLAIICHTPGIEDNWEFKPYIGYIQGQADRYKIAQSDKDYGACVLFQRGISKTNFAIDTKGEYCQCNLIDSSSTVKNATAAMPDYCKDCQYNKTLECNTCGSENFPEKCEYHWWWNKTLEETFQILELKKTYEQLINNMANNQTCNCDGSCTCNHQEDIQPIFCVKNYRF